MALGMVQTIAIAAICAVIAFVAVMLLVWLLRHRAKRKRGQSAAYSTVDSGSGTVYREGFPDIMQEEPEKRVPKTSRFKERFFGHGARGQSEDVPIESWATNASASRATYPQPWIPVRGEFVAMRDPKMLASDPNYPTHFSGNESDSDESRPMRVSTVAAANKQRTSGQNANSGGSSPRLMDRRLAVTSNSIDGDGSSSGAPSVTSKNSRRPGGLNMSLPERETLRATSKSEPSSLQGSRASSPSRHVWGPGISSTPSSSFSPLAHSSHDLRTLQRVLKTEGENVRNASVDDVFEEPPPFEKPDRTAAVQSDDEIPSFPDPRSLRFCGKRGVLYFRIRYLAVEEKVEVMVNSAHMLPAKTKQPFVKVKILKDAKRTLLKDGGHQAGRPGSLIGLDTTEARVSAFTPKLDRRASTSANAKPDLDPCNPHFQQTLVFEGVDSKQLQKATIRLSVKDDAAKRSDHLIGEVLLGLKDLHLGIEWKMFTINLEQSASFVAKPGSPRGEVTVGLKFVSNGTALQCRILKAINLPSPTTGNSYGAYISIRLMSGDTELMRTLTPQVQCFDDGKAMFNFKTNIDLCNHSHGDVQLILVAKARMSSFKRKSLEVGKIILGARADGDKECRQWSDAEHAEEAMATHRLHS